MNEPMISLQDVKKEYPRHCAIDGITLDLPAGICLALLGHNGAGKTTLMKLILGLIRPTAGSVRVLGGDPCRVEQSLRRQIGFLPENVSFHEELTGRDTLRFYARLKEQPLASVAPLLDRVGLLQAADRRVKTYSKGMRQRLGLAQSLLGPPRLMLLDEPTTGLDPVLRQEFFYIIHELNRAGTTIILSSHVLTELEARTDQVAIMRQGRLTAFGSLEELRGNANLHLMIRLIAFGKARQLADYFRDLVILDSNENTLDLSCPIGDKMALLRRVASLDAATIDDIEIRLPTLDDIYLHFGHVPHQWEEEKNI